MNVSDIFHQLQAGTRFAGKRKSFPSKSSDQTLPPSALPSSLDFFAPKKDNDVPAKKKQKIDHKQEIVQNDLVEASEEGEEEEKEMSKRAIRRMKNKNKIQADAALPEILQSFKHLKTRYEAKDYLIKNIGEAGFTKPTPIQMQAIPALVERHEVLACAPTGSGKTAAFTIPMLMSLKNPSKGNHRALVLSPTRELAMQTYQQIKRLSKDKGFRICLLTKATTPLETDSTTRRFDIIVSTPLRLVRLIQDGSIQLDSIEYLVMDEADQLFELGFLAQIDEIIAACSNKSILRSLFSATMPSEVEEMANSFLRNPARIVVGAKNSAASTIQQRLVYCGREEGKLLALRQMIAKGIKPPVILFVQSKDRAMELFHELVYDNINVDVITSDRTKAQRDKTVKQFRMGNIWVLIATDLMARGMDFKCVNLVINYDIPPSGVQYIHRIGRAGRAGRSGEAISFYTTDDLALLRNIVSVMRASNMALPEWMSTLPKPTKKDAKMTPKRSSIDERHKYTKKNLKKRKKKFEKETEEKYE